MRAAGMRVRDEAERKTASHLLTGKLNFARSPGRGARGVQSMQARSRNHTKHKMKKATSLAETVLQSS